MQFESAFSTLVMYCRAKTTPDIDAQYHKRVRFYPFNALKESVEFMIDNRKPIPSSFPSPNELSTACADWLNGHPEIRDTLMVYDQDEDLDFPIKKLWTAFDILTKHGGQRFNSYCQSVRMPRADKERIICKARTVANKGGDRILKAKLKDMADGIFDNAPSLGK